MIQIKIHFHCIYWGGIDADRDVPIRYHRDFRLCYVSVISSGISVKNKRNLSIGIDAPPVVCSVASWQVPAAMEPHEAWATVAYDWPNSGFTNPGSGSKSHF